jgi:diguanylate cyclase (GGDEF)-like protein/putative nucleotidyltransferase with HDIG domain
MTVIVLQLSVFLISPVFFVGSYFYFSTGFLLFGLLEVLAGILLIFLVYFNPINYILKKNIILAIFYLASIFVLITTGISGGGMISLMTTIIFINLLTPSYKVVMIYFGINSFVLLVLSLFLYTGLFDSFMIYNYIETWPFLVLLVSVYSLAILYSIQFYKKTLIEQYQLSHNRTLYLNSIINSINDILITIDDKGIVNYYNQSATNEFFQSYDVLGSDFKEAMEPISLYNLNEGKNANFLEFNVNTNHYSYESPFQNKTIYLTQQMFPIMQNDITIGAVYVFHDVTHQYLKEQELTYISFHDHLTKLYNRRFFEVELSRLDVVRNLPLTLIMIDVNGLKLINDSFGHDVGDQLLIAVASSIKEASRKSEICSRIGGDEFVILLPKTSKQNAISLVKRIQKVASTKNINGIDISFAVGIGVKTKEDQNITQVFKVMEDDLYRNKLSESNSVRSKTIDLILTTLYEKNNREMNHSKRVSEFCEMFAKALKYDDDQIKKIKLAGLMHDIGKIAIEETILNKKEKLNEAELKKIKQHSDIGYRILSSLNEFNEIAEYVYQHHERWDGTGYPNKLKGEEISYEARILSIADSFDAMTGMRTYRASLTKEEAINELIRCKNTQFDPKLVDFFINKVLVKEELL